MLEIDYLRVLAGNISDHHSCLISVRPHRHQWITLYALVGKSFQEMMMIIIVGLSKNLSSNLFSLLPPLIWMVVAVYKLEKTPLLVVTVMKLLQQLLLFSWFQSAMRMLFFFSFRWDEMSVLMVIQVREERRSLMRDERRCLVREERRCVWV